MPKEKIKSPNRNPYENKSRKNKKYPKLDKRVTNREFKILLKPNKLDRHKEVDRIQKVVEALCAEMKILFTAPESMSPGLRNVYFFDTDDQSLRRNKLILRVRETRSDIWTDDWCEVTFKCRSDDIERSWSHNPIPTSGIPHRLRFKEEILKDGPLGSLRKIYSHNSIMSTVPIEKVHSRKLKQLSNLYPGINAINLPFSKELKLVGGETNKILEAQVTLGHIKFAPNIEAHCELAIWFRTVGEPIVGELAFAYKVHKPNRKDLKAHKIADDFFSSLQHMVSEDIFNGTTKTALVYGTDE